jgi:toxin ParE1/3/4
MGSPRLDLSPTAHLLIEGRYIVIYEPMPYGIFIATVAHGARDVENRLG